MALWVFGAKKLDGWVMGDGWSGVDTPETFMATRAPVALNTLKYQQKPSQNHRSHENQKP